MNFGGLVQKVAEKNFSMWPRDCSCDILVEKNCGCFLPHLKSLPEVKLKRFRLIALTREVSNQPSLDSFLCFTLMRSVLIKFSQLRKKKCKMYGSIIKRASRSTTELNHVFKDFKCN